MSISKSDARNTARISVYVLGTFRVVRAGGVLPDDVWGRRKAAELVKLLVVTPGHSRHREQIADMLWPDIAPHRAAGMFNQVLHAARRALEPDRPLRAASSSIEVRNGIVSLMPASIWIDLDHFENLASAARRANDISTLERAVASYGGDLLPGDLYEPWAEARRAGVRQLYIELLLDLASIREREAQYDLAIESLTTALHWDPAREEVHRRLMRLYALAGHHDLALRRYDACRQALAQELDVAPDWQTEHLFTDIAALRAAPAKLRVDADNDHRSHATTAFRLGSVLLSAGRYEEGLAELERAAAVYQQVGNLEQLALLTAEMGRGYFLLLRPLEGIERLEGISRDRLSAPARSAVDIALAQLYWQGSRYEDQLEAATRAEDAGRLVQDDRLRGEALAWQGIALLALEHVEAAMETLKAAIPLAEGSRDYLTLSRALNTIAAAYQEQGDFSQQKPYLERAVEAAELSGDPARIAFMRYRHGWHTWMEGNWPLARAEFERAIFLARTIGSSWVLPHALYGLAWLQHAQADYAGALTHAATALEEAERGGDIRLTWAVHGLLAETEMATGNVTAAVDRVTVALTTPGMAEGDRSALLAMLARAYLYLGDRARARSTVDAALAHVMTTRWKPALVEVLLARALVAWHDGEWAEAVAQVQDALHLAEQMGNPYLEARARDIYGMLLSIEGNHTLGQEQLRRASAIFEQLCAARPDAELLGRSAPAGPSWGA